MLTFSFLREIQPFVPHLVSVRSDNKYNRSFFGYLVRASRAHFAEENLEYEVKDP